MSKPSILDYILGAIVGFHFWWQRHFGGKLWQCSISPSGEHYWIVKDWADKCKFCGTPKPRVWVEDSDGRNPQDRKVL